MKRIIALWPAIAALSVLFCPRPAFSQEIRQDNLVKHVNYLASDTLKGRQAGTEGAKLAREYIEDEFRNAGLKPFFRNRSGKLLQEFKADGHTYCNVVGFIEGSDSELKKEYVVIGAHYDHLGVRGGEIYPGADDNASGSAALMELARVLNAKRTSLKRSIVLAAFDAEEIGLYGSTALAGKMADSLGTDCIKLMMSLDMVGYYKQNGELILQGSSTIRNGAVLIEEEARREKIKVRTKPFETSVFTATDTDGFARKGIATLAVTTGLKSPYHKPEDVAEAIDFEGLEKVTDFISELAVVACDPFLQPSGHFAAKHADKCGKLDFAASVGAGSACISFPRGGFVTRAGAAFSAGASVQYLFSPKFGVRSGAYMERIASAFPVEQDFFYDSDRYIQTQLTVPLEFVCRMADNGTAVSVGLGGYYSLAPVSRLKGRNGLKAEAVLPGNVFRNQLGWDIDLNFELGSWNFGVESRIQATPLFKGSSSPKAKLRMSFVKVGYNF